MSETSALRLFDCSFKRENDKQVFHLAFSDANGNKIETSVKLHSNADEFLLNLMAEQSFAQALRTILPSIAARIVLEPADQADARDSANTTRNRMIADYHDASERYAFYKAKTDKMAEILTETGVLSTKTPGVYEGSYP